MLCVTVMLGKDGKLPQFTVFNVRLYDGISTKHVSDKYKKCLTVDNSETDPARLDFFKILYIILIDPNILNQVMKRLLILMIFIGIFTRIVDYSCLKYRISTKLPQIVCQTNAHILIYQYASYVYNFDVLKIFIHNR